jgi:hypothetical protein
MSEKRTFILQPLPHPSRRLAIEAIRDAQDGFAVTLQEPTRSIEQNAAQWPILQCWSDQKEWPVNGKTVKLSKEEWKDILTAAFDREEVRVAQGLDGGMVLLGHRTSQFGKRKFSAWLEFLHAASAQHGVEVPPRIEDVEPEGRMVAA